MAQLILLPGKERSAFKQNHPWIFAGSVGRLEGRARPGDTVEVLADNLQDPSYLEALQVQHAKISDPALTPSARVLQTLITQKISFQDYALQLSAKHATQLRQAGLSPEQTQQAAAQAKASLEEQKRLEDGDTESFDAYVKRFHEALKAPAMSKN